MDFSENAELALDYAVALAAKLDAKIHLVNAISPTIIGARYGIVYTESVMDSTIQGNRNALERLVAARRGQATFGSTVLEMGDARAVIDETAIKLGADLIVMGTRGRRGFSRMMLGSVAEAIVRTAPCPVLLVREGHEL